MISSSAEKVVLEVEVNQPIDSLSDVVSPSFQKARASASCGCDGREGRLG